jgi:hypothetical protein
MRLFWLSKQVTKTTTTVSKNNRGRKKPRNASNKQKARNNNNKNRTARVDNRMYFRLSKCATDYLKALTDPFGFTRVGMEGMPCIPDLLDAPSTKYRSVARGSLVVPATNSGFLLLNTHTAPANNAYSILNSNALYILVDQFPTTGVETGVTRSFFNQSPYSSAEIGVGAGNVQYRVVALGIRVRYIGTVLNRGGRIIPFRHPNNQPFTGYTLGDVMGYTNVHPSTVDDKWHAVNYMPVRATDYEYKSVAISGVPATAGASAVGILINPNGSTAVTYEWEAVMYTEWIGEIPLTTPSHSDVPGMSAIRNLMEGGLDADPNTNLFQEVMKGVQAIGPQNISGFVTTAGNAFLQSAYF